MVEGNIAIACAAVVVYVASIIVGWYREDKNIKFRDDLIKQHRIRETELLNRLMARTTEEYAMLNNQAAAIEEKIFTEDRATVKEKNIQEYLEKAGMDPDGFSEGGVAVV